jgi:hypothetical protein
MIEKLFGLINEEELLFLDNICLNFTEEDTPRLTNYYHRIFLNKNVDLLNYQTKAKQYLKDKFKIDYEIEGIWINKVSVDTNKNDGFHLDNNSLTIVTYINEDFEGGEFEYFVLGVKPNQKIKPKRNLSLITNDKLPHKVLPVTSGERYSLVVFFTVPIKDKKSML